MKKRCRFSLHMRLWIAITGTAILLLAATPGFLFAQAPVISYSSPQIYTSGTAIALLAPTASGVAAVGYSSTRLTIGTGFNTPEGIATDGAGNVYVADNGNHLVKKILAGGGATTTLGSGYEGPYGVAVDIAGNVYVADGGNGVKMIPVGGGSQVNIGSGFISSKGVAVDAAGNVYVADNGFIVKIPVGGGPMITLGTVSNAYGLTVDAAGNVYAANGGASISEIPASGGGGPVNIGSGFSIPNSVAVDAAGNLYVADYGHNAIKKVPAGGGSIVTLLSGLTNAYGIAIDGKGNLYVSLSSLNTVKMIAPVGGYFAWPFLPAGLSFAATTGNISGTPAVSSPAANYTVTAYSATGSDAAIVNIAVNASSPTAISVSYSSPQTYAIGTAIAPLSPASSGVAATGYSSSLAGLGSGFNGPEGVAVDAAGNIYVADFSNGAVKKIPAGGGAPVTLGTFAQPNGVAVDLSGNVYVSNGGIGIMKIPAGGGSPVVIGTGITNPDGVGVDAAGNVYLSDLGDNSVKEIPVTGGATIVLSTAGSLLSPYGVAVDAAGNVYVADLEDNAVKKIPVDGTGVVVVGGIVSVPFGVATDNAGNVYVTDSGNKRIREIPAGGGATVTLSTGFVNPYGIAVDAAGNVYVADQLNNTVKQIRPVGGYYINSFLPAGLSFNSTTGTITGTPSAKTAAANYTVTAYNNSGPGTAIVNIKIASNNAGLASVLLSSGTLSPSFTGLTTSYTASVSNTSALVTVTPAVEDARATVKVNGTAVISGSASGAITLTVGPNTINIVVTAEDGVTTKTYTVVITRAPSSDADLATLHISAGTLSPSFAAGTAAYTASVGNGITTITLTPTTADVNATIKVNGVTVASGATSGLIQLLVGSNVITTTVTAQDSATTKKYILTVTRAASVNANLSAIQIVGNPATSETSYNVGFLPSITSYTVHVSAGTTAVSAEAFTSDAGASLEINGTPSISGEEVTIPISTGPSNLTFTVTAQDGVTTKTYTVIVAPGSVEDRLSALQPNTGALSPAFDSGNSIYALSVANAVATVMITPTTVDVNATVQVNGTAVASGTASGPIPVNVGMNTVAITVTAQDEISTMTYNLYVFRPSATPQPPTVSYGGPQVYTLNNPIAALTPASSGVAAPGYSNTATSMGVAFNQPSGVAADAKGNVYVACAGDGTVIKIPAGGGTPVIIASGLTELSEICLDAASNIYVVEAYTEIVEIPATGGPANTLFDGDGAGLGPIQIEGIAVNAGTVYFCSTSRIFSSSQGGGYGYYGQYPYPTTGVAINASGDIYVTDQHLLYFGLSFPLTAINFVGYSSIIKCLSVDGSSSLFEIVAVGNSMNNTVEETDTDFGSEYPVSTIGPVFANPTGMAVDGAANVYVADGGTNEVAVIKPTGGYHIWPALPSGLYCSRITGVISGQPNATSPPTNYVITAYNSTGSSSATVNITVAADATLSNLKVNSASLSPLFTAATTSYTTTVANAVSAVTVTPTANDIAATIKVNGIIVASGATSAGIPLNIGPNTITTVVAARDGFTTKTYTVVVTRAPSAVATLSSIGSSVSPLTPVFNSATTSYTLSVPNATATMTVKPVTTDPNATIKVNGTALASGTTSAAIPLAEGTATAINVVVTAADGTTIKTYTITVTRAPSAVATLSAVGSSITPLAPVFSSTTTSYTLSVPNATATMTVKPVTTDPNATIKVNGTALTPGTTSAALPLAEGTTTAINVVVTAQNGTTTKTYTITVTRAPSAVATLSAIGSSVTPLSPIFNSTVTSYTVSVPNATATMTVKPVTTDPNATIKVNGTALASGTTSAALPLAEGTTTAINILVTAQNGTNTKTYTITVTRAPSGVATLSGIGSSITPLTPVFTPATTSYTLSVANGVTTMTIKPVTTDAHATIKVNGTALASGTTSAPIALAVGSNTITTVVTAQDGTTTKTYTITVTRAAGGADSFDPISVSKATETPILNDDGIIIHQAVSPNGDGINDFLQIDNISQYPDNKLTIMNRSGQLIYEANAYDNSSKVFDGHSNKNGQMQLPGTYFYQLDYTVNGIVKHKTGYLILKY